MIAVLAMTTAASADTVTSTGKVVGGVRTVDAGPTANVLVPSYVQDEEEMIPENATIENNIEFNINSSVSGKTILGTTLRDKVNGDVKLNINVTLEEISKISFPIKKELNELRKNLWTTL